MTGPVAQLLPGGHGGKRVGDGPRPSASDVLVAHRRCRGRVTQSLHEFGQCRADLGRQYRPGVPEVVDVEIGSPGYLTGLTEPGRRLVDHATHDAPAPGGLAVEARECEMPTTFAGKQQGVRSGFGELVQMLPNGLQQVRRNRHVPVSRLALWRGDHALSADQHDRSANLDPGIAAAQDEIPSTKLAHLAEPQRAPGHQ